MKNDLVKVFNNEQFGSIRTMEKGDKVLFCANDVAKALGYKIPKDAVKQHCRGAVKYLLTDSLGRKQETNFIPEGDVYRLIVKSQLPSAQNFEHWLFDEVLPTIRKTGQYNLAVTDPLQLAQNLIDISKKYIEAETERRKLAISNEIMKPKAEFFDALVERKSNTCFTDTAKMLKISEKKFIGILLEKKFIYRDAKNKLKPYSIYVGGKKPYFEIKESKSIGSDWVGQQTLITPYGREAFRLLLS